MVQYVCVFVRKEVVNVKLFNVSFAFYGFIYVIFLSGFLLNDWKNIIWPLMNLIHIFQKFFFFWGGGGDTPHVTHSNSGELCQISKQQLENVVICRMWLFVIITVIVFSLQCHQILLNFVQVNL